MSTAVEAQGVGAARPPASPDPVRPGTIFQLLAAWLLFAGGGIGIVFMPVIVFSTKTDVPPARIGAYTLACILSLVGGALLYSRHRWGWWAALGISVVVPAILIGIGGLTTASQGYVAGAFALVEILLMLLGRRAAGDSEAMAIASAGIPFRLKVGIVWAAIFAAIAVVLALFQLDTGWVRENLNYIAFGLKFTIALALAAIVLAVTLALFGALGRLSHNPVAYGLSGFYTSFFRGTPLIVQLFIIYAALPQIGGNLERNSLTSILALTAFQAGVLGLGLNYGAYMTEIFRAGIQAVGHGQAEAADALGMTYAQRMRRVVLPQAARVIIPPTGNEFIAMMKDTALVGLLGTTVAQAELFRRAQIVGNGDLKRLEALLAAAALYWALTAVFTFFQRKLERHMSKGYERGAATAPTKEQRTRWLAASAGGGPGGGGMMVEMPGDVRPGVLPEEEPRP
jgi:polar amino acid transport system permease protein